MGRDPEIGASDSRFNCVGALSAGSTGLRCLGRKQRDTHLYEFEHDVPKSLLYSMPHERVNLLLWCEAS